MIGKIMEKRRDGLSSFRDLINYVTRGIKGGKIVEKVEAAGCINLLSMDTATAEMESTAFQNVRCGLPAFHFMLSWREHEHPTLDQVKDAVNHALRSLGLEECQATWGLHNDTDCLHVHVAVNRIHPETYKAIDPAHGWTKNELEKACREIELAQGWAVEQTGKFCVENDKVTWKTEAKDRAAKRERRVSQVARDFETRTGEKSAERIAIEEAAPIILAATSWMDMHRQLAGIGVRYQQKGSGAVLQVGEEFVKASSSHREAAIAHLVKRFGEFQPPPENQIVAASAPKPVSPMPEGWSDYANLRRKRKSARRSAQQTLNISLRDQYRQLKSTQLSERKIFYTQGWQGQSHAMRAERSLLAARHAAQLADLRDHQNKTRSTFSQHWRRLPTFREVLEGFDRHPALGHAVREELRYSGHIASLHGSNGTPTLVDIRGFFGQTQGRVVAYSTSLKPASPAFIDYGRKIHVHEDQDASAILAALQLATQKWNGRITLGGPEAYKIVAIRLALVEGITITNPELQPLIAQERALLESVRQRHPQRNGQKQAPQLGSKCDPSPLE